MADNFENLGFSVKIDGADSAVSHLDNIIQRLDKIKKLQGANNVDKERNSSKTLSQEEKYAKKVANATELLNSKKYEELRRTQLLNEQRKKEIDLRLKQELGIKSNTKSLVNYITKLTSVVMLARRFAQFMGDAVKESAEYIESLNLFAVAFGNSYKEQLNWALGIAEAYGLANNEVLKFAGTFRELASSLGLVGETADLVSETVTKLGYDLAALFNTTVEQAMEKLQSGVFSGNVRPLRSFGIDISQQQIDALIDSNDALRKLGVSAKSMTQADKTIARLIITLRSGKDSFGTMAREINNLQSQFRIFEGSLANFKFAIGDLINKPLAVAMTYINGFIIGITEIIRAFVHLQKKDETPKIILNTTLGAEEANEQLDELNGKLASFDKFNVLQQSGGSDSRFSLTEALNTLLEEQVELYNKELSTAMDNLKNKAVEIGNTIKGWFVTIDEENGFVELTDAAELLKNTLGVIVGIKIYGWLFNLASAIKICTINFNLMATASNILAGTGLFLVITNTIDLISNWDKLDNTGKAVRITMIAVGVALTVFSTLTKIALKDTTLLTTAFKLQKIAAMGLAVGGIGLLVANLTNLIGNWDELSTFEKVIGIFGAIGAAALAAAAAVAAFHGAWTIGTAVPAIIGGLVAITSAFVAFKKDIKGYANGGYSNANLIMTHENGKREWVGKAAGSSAIVNDTQMSDIMEMAVAKGVYNALSARSAMGSGESTNETIVVKIGEEEVFNAVRRTAKRQGKDFANV